MSKVVSLGDLKKKTTNNVKYDTVEAHGVTIRIGSVSAKDMLEWVEGNRQDEQKKRVAGLRLLVKSLVGPEEDGSPRVPEDEFQSYIDSFLEKDNLDNGKIIKAVLKLNGFGDDAAEKAKNELSGAQPVPSPSASGANTGA